MQPARYRARIENDILRIQPGGGTEIFRRARHGVSGHVGRPGAQEARDPADRRPRAHQGMKDLVQAMMAECDHGDHGRPGRRRRSELFARSPTSAAAAFTTCPTRTACRGSSRGDRVDRAPGRGEWFPVQQVANADFLKGIAINQDSSVKQQRSANRTATCRRPGLREPAPAPLRASRQMASSRRLRWPSEATPISRRSSPVRSRSSWSRR